jgi:hypothetical protein
MNECFHDLYRLILKNKMKVSSVGHTQDGSRGIIRLSIHFHPQLPFFNGRLTHYLHL